MLMPLAAIRPPRQKVPTLFAVTFAVAFAATFAGGGCIGFPTPTVIRPLDSLPVESSKRAQIIESSLAMAPPETRAPKSRPAEGAVHTAAATVPAILAWLATGSANAFIGLRVLFDENQAVQPTDVPAAQIREREGVDDTPPLP